MDDPFGNETFPDVSDIYYSTIDIARAGLSILSGLVLTAAFPNIGQSYLAWLALVPLLFGIRGLPPFAAFRLGLLSGIVHYLTLAYWLHHTMNTYGELPWFISIPVMVLISIYMALYFAAFSAILCIFGKKPVNCLIMIPFLWVTLEYIKSFFLSGLPWALLGYSQFRILPLIQIADLTGVYGVSFLVAAVNGILFMVCLTFSKYTWFGSEPTKPVSFTALTGGIILMGLVLHYGNIRLKQINNLIDSAPKPTITVIQGNVDQSRKWDSRFQKYTTRKYIDLSLESRPSSSGLVVWPETALPFYFTYDRPLTRTVINGIQKAGCDFVIGSPSFTYEKGKIQYFNSAFLISADGSVTGKYDKAHLVPFGEYVPLKKWLPFMGKIVEHVGDFQAGEKGKTLPWGEVPLGILICFEVIFPDLSRAAAANGAQLLINITNDAWYGRTSAPYQHFSMSVFRAVENRRALVRSANTGISGFIDPAGQTYGETDIYIHTTSSQRMPLLQTKSFYTRQGDVFAWGCLVFILFSAGFGILKRAN